MPKKKEQKKFRIYVKQNRKLKVQQRPLPFQPKRSSAVEFVLRHISAMPYEEACGEAERLMNVVDITEQDKMVIARIMRQRCPKRSQ